MTPLRLIRDAEAPIEIEQERALLGREPSCDVVLDDKSVSRRHLLVEQRGGRWHVTDQGSANGTFLNGEQVMEADLYDGQELRLGTCRLWVQLEEEMPQTLLMAAGDPPVTTLMPAISAGSAPPPRPAAAPGPAPAARSYSAASAPVSSAPPSAAAWADPAPAARQAPAAGSAQQEAAALLGLAATATPYEVSERYQELSNDLQAKLQTARTPNLKATYERNLDEIRRAAELLAPGSASPGVSEADLPSAQPVVIPDAPDGSFMDSSRPALVREPTPSPPAGPSSLTTGASAVIVVLLGFTAFFAMSKQKNDKALITMTKSADLADARAKWVLFKPFDDLEKGGALKNGRLKICNRSGQALEIPWLGAVYLDDKDPNASAQGISVKNYNSDYCRQEYSLSIPAGAEKDISFSGSTERCRWSGEGLFYSMAVRRPGAAAEPPPPEPAKPAKGAKAAAPAAPAPSLVFLSGLLNNRQDCVTIGQGW